MPGCIVRHHLSNDTIIRQRRDPLSLGEPEFAVRLFRETETAFMKPFDPQQLQVDESKITGYLLSHANGRGKAVFFLGIGFRVEAWQELAEAIKAQAMANPIATAVDSPYGTRYSVDGELLTPSGRQPRVRTVWILESGSDKLRLITAFPV